MPNTSLTHYGLLFTVPTAETLIFLMSFRAGGLVKWRNKPI